jgi:hypothetical protein
MNDWTKPRRYDDGQGYLFRVSVDELLAKLRVSRDDARRWNAIGWLSFDVDDHKELEPPLEWELEFIRSLARSGLNDAQVNELLETLEEPYRYRPESIAYHFEHGWVSPPPAAEPFDVVEETLDDWLESLAEEGDTDRLETLQDRIAVLLEQHEDDGGSVQQTGAIR